ELFLNLKCQGARHHCPASAVGSCRRGDRISFLLHLLTAAIGTKRRLGNVRFFAACLGLSGHRSASSIFTPWEVHLRSAAVPAAPLAAVPMDARQSEQQVPS